CFIEKLGQRDWPISPETGSLLQTFLSEMSFSKDWKTGMFLSSSCLETFEPTELSAPEVQYGRINLLQW
ncbi:hypothetical protein ACSVIJ_24250, partial [Pseudomonas sp. NCHU5208]|uniref:hypothetical protein n=1 Tax=unclassified Pseudomonas TaxID=196821 RepID=UPI003F9440EE